MYHDGQHIYEDILFLPIITIFITYFGEYSDYIDEHNLHVTKNKPLFQPLMLKWHKNM